MPRSGGAAATEEAEWPSLDGGGARGSCQLAARCCAAGGRGGGGRSPVGTGRVPATAGGRAAAAYVVLACVHDEAARAGGRSGGRPQWRPLLDLPGAPSLGLSFGPTSYIYVKHHLLKKNSIVIARAACARRAYM